MTDEKKKQLIERLKKKIITEDKDVLALVSGGGIYNMAIRDAIKIVRRYG